MENTHENKSKFFAQYWGQEINDYRLSRYSTRRNEKVSGSSMGFLNLKPLSSITDEDALEIAKRVFKNTEFHSASRIMENTNIVLNSILSANTFTLFISAPPEH